MSTSLLRHLMADPATLASWNAICRSQGMVTHDRFNALDGSRQLDVLVDEGVYLTERSWGAAYSLYYQVGSFYVEIKLVAVRGARVSIHTFTQHDPEFNDLIDAVPIDVYRELGTTR
jgi:hypothetical protein